MWKKIIERFERKSNDNESVSRRRFPRRAIDTCAIKIDDVTYPIQDWSKNGALFSADGRIFEENSVIPITMRFRLSDEVMNVALDARVIRSKKSGVALEFINVTNDVKQAFNRVIDHALATDFSDTQSGRA